ncbi:MAG: M48 family metalloprotease, partial [Deferribacterales bacterium]
MNGLKTAFLMTLLTILFLLIGRMLGGQNGMIIALIIALGMNFFSYWFSDKIVLMMYRAKEVTEAEAPNLYAMVRRIASRAGIPMPKVYIIDNPSPNAFATGRNPSNAAVAVTTGILHLLDSKELEGVIAHEIAHITNRDILIGTIAATFAAAIMFLADMARWAMIFGGSRHSDDDEGGSPIGAIGAI